MKKLAIFISFVSSALLAEPLNQPNKSVNYDLAQAQADYAWATIEHIAAMRNLKACYENLKAVQNYEKSILQKAEFLPDENRAEAIEEIKQKFSKKRPDCSLFLISVTAAKEKMDAAEAKVTSLEKPSQDKH